MTLVILIHGMHFTRHCRKHIPIAIIDYCLTFKGREDGVVGPKFPSLNVGAGDV